MALGTVILDAHVEVLRKAPELIGHLHAAYMHDHILGREGVRACLTDSRKLLQQMLVEVEGAIGALDSDAKFQPAPAPLVQRLVPRLVPVEVA